MSSVTLNLDPRKFGSGGTNLSPFLGLQSGPPLIIKFPHACVCSCSSYCMWVICTIANAATLASGQQCLPVYVQSQMRNHLRESLERGSLLPFPISRLGRVKDRAIRFLHAEIPIFCLCRMPEFFSKEMVACSKCKKWRFHLEICVQPA